MALDADIILDRIRLKKKARRWQGIAIGILILSIIIFSKAFNIGGNAGYIGEISIENMIINESAQVNAIQKLTKDKALKALIVNVNSPGGTIAGSEAIYRSIKRISKRMPVVAVVKDYAASGGYMVASSADVIIASNGSIVGSIGVLAQNFEVTDLAKNWGINIAVNKTSNLKANPSPFEKTDPEALLAQTALLNDFLEYFKSIIEEERKLTGTELAKVSDGRVFTGRQAIEVGLVDAIGDKIEALEWLNLEHNISLKVRKISLEEEQGLGSIIGSWFIGAIAEGSKSIFSSEKTNKYLAVMPNSL